MKGSDLSAAKIEPAALRPIAPARAVTWHVERRILLNAHRTVVVK